MLTTIDITTLRRVIHFLGSLPSTRETLAETVERGMMVSELRGIADRESDEVSRVVPAESMRTEGGT
jgi:hypothetical protein